MNYKKISIAALIAMGSSMVFAQDAEIATWAGFRKAAVSFTFDDGPQSDVGVALPMFDKYGYKATFNIVTGWVGGQGMISWPEAVALQPVGQVFHLVFIDLVLEQYDHCRLLLSELECL